MTAYLEPIVLTEASKARQELIERLDSIPLTRMYQASFKAVVRLHLFFTGWTHESFSEYAERAGAVIVKRAGKDQVLDGATGFEVQSQLLTLWGDVFAKWSRRFEAARVEAASIPFGVWAVAHERLIVEGQRSKVEGRTSKVERRRSKVEDESALTPALSRGERELTEAVEDGVFSPQLSVLLNAASEHLYGDSLNLSARVWRIDREARDGIAQVILRGVANGDSAWNMAKELEQFLGAGAECPRWTSTRLYGKTKTEIAQGDTAGLMASPCDGRGVAYNALRLARTEIQKAHALATDRILASQPWVKQEQVNLSAAHPEADICDEVVAQGEDGKGIYPVGTIELPLHPNCLCYKTAVLMPEKEFTAQLNGWLKGEQAWAEMDAYAELVSGATGQVSGSILANAINLAVWLFGDERQLAAFGG